VTTILPAECVSIRQAAAILRRGGLVAFPTETVYGLGADAQNEAAVKAMFAAKGRPVVHPVIVHLADAALVEQFVAELPPVARKLAAAFWPGPMTLVLRRNERICKLATGGLETVGIRVPDHPIALALLREFGGPLAAPSANRFGRVSCTRAAHVVRELEDRVELILDGGECSVGIESTIIDVTSPQPAVLRPGAVTTEQVAAVVGSVNSLPGAGAPRVSGSLPAHYAPRATVELIAEDQLIPRATELTKVGKKVAVLSRGLVSVAPPNVLVLTAPLADEDFARSLYTLLRHVDEQGCDVVLTTLPPQRGLGTAIADRLRRAAGPRDDRTE
jgi:L-threonylcarbamoyladenylate synthase